MMTHSLKVTQGVEWSRGMQGRVGQKPASTKYHPQPNHKIGTSKIYGSKDCRNKCRGGVDKGLFRHRKGRVLAWVHRSVSRQPHPIPVVTGCMLVFPGGHCMHASTSLWSLYACWCFLVVFACMPFISGGDDLINVCSFVANRNSLVLIELRRSAHSVTPPHFVVPVLTTFSSSPGSFKLVVLKVGLAK